MKQEISNNDNEFEDYAVPAEHKEEPQKHVDLLGIEDDDNILPPQKNEPVSAGNSTKNTKKAENNFYDDFFSELNGKPVEKANKAEIKEKVNGTKKANLIDFD